MLKDYLMKQRKFFSKVMLILFVIGIYYILIRPFLKPSMSTVPIELIMAFIVIGALVYSVLSVVFYLIGLIINSIRNRSKTVVIIKLKRKTKLFITSACFLVFLTVISQMAAYTPPILDDEGKILKNSIATIEKVSINNSKQYITVRGHNQDNPVLLFLAGGPGGTQLAATRDVLSGLEEDFVVVNWEQPGSSKSYHAVPMDDLTRERYIEDGHQLTLYLKERFNQEKIFVVGQSWGSALGIWLVEEYPEDYFAFIGAGQMVSFLDTEIYCYNKAMEIAEEKGDKNTVNKLKEQGPPPYYGKGITMKSATYLMYLFNEMAHHPNINHTDHNTFKDIAGPEYGLYDKLNYFLALVKTFDQVYPQLYDIDLRESATNFEVPIYILHGRYDLNAPTHLAEDYYNLINAPYKEFIWFEHSGHDLWIEENELFVETMKYILKQEDFR